jgi:hypothetical protein
MKDMNVPGGTLVEHSPHHRKDKGLRKAATAGKGRMKWQYKGVLS